MRRKSAGINKATQRFRCDLRNSSGNKQIGAVLCHQPQKAAYLDVAREKGASSMSSVVSGKRSGKVQHTAEDLGPFHDPYPAGTYPPFACILSLLLLALPITMLAGHGNARRVTITEAVWVGTTLLGAGDYEVKWDGTGLVQVSFLRGNRMIVNARAIAAVAVDPHDRPAVKIKAISESSKALEGIVWKDVSLTFDTIHPF
jgi:hypothetical protein